MEDFQKLEEVAVRSEEIYDGKVVHLFKDIVRLPNGEEAVREVIRHVGAVCVIPVTDDGKVIMERQFRYPYNRVFLEIPAGKLEATTEDRLEAAKRELKEETGYTAEEWIHLGDYDPTIAFCDEHISMYLARGLKKGERHLDEDEFLNVITMELSELIDAVMSGKITDGKTQVAILKAARILASEIS